MPEPNINEAHKKCHPHYTVFFFGSYRELLLEKKYFNAKDSFRHTKCIMECSWCPKRNPCSLLITQEDQTKFQEFLVVFSLRAPWQNFTISFRRAEVCASKMSSEAISFVAWSMCGQLCWNLLSIGMADPPVEPKTARGSSMT